MTRPAEHYVHAGGGVVIVPARIAALLNHHVLDSFRPQVREVDAELDAVLVALAVAGRAWRSSATGTANKPTPELDPSSGWLSTTAAAIQLRMTDRGVRKAIASGYLDAESVAGRWRISREAVAHFRARR